MHRDPGGLADGAAMNQEADAAPGVSPPSGPPPPPPPPPGGWGSAPWDGGSGWPGGAWGGQPGGTPPPGPNRPSGRRRALLIGASIFGALVIAAASGTVAALFVRGGGAPASAPPTQQPSRTPGPATSRALAAYRQMLAAADASAGYHYVSVSSSAGQPITQETITGDAGQNDGTQVITLQSTYGTEQFTIRLTADGRVYFQGNTPALEDQIGVVASSAPALDGRWILVMVGDGPYQQLEQGITVASHLQGDSLVPSSLATVHTQSGTAQRISGGIEQGGSLVPGVAAHFDVSSTSKLPQAYVQSAPGLGLSATDTFSAWGTAPSVSAPSGAAAWSSLRTQAPPGGYGQGGTQGGTPSPGPATPTPSGGSV